MVRTIAGTQERLRVLAAITPVTSSIQLPSPPPPEKRNNKTKAF